MNGNFQSLVKIYQLSVDLWNPASKSEEVAHAFVVPSLEGCDPRRRRESCIAQERFQTVDKSLKLRSSSLLKDVAEIIVTLNASVSCGRNSLEKSFERGPSLAGGGRGSRLRSIARLRCLPWTKDWSR